MSAGERESPSCLRCSFPRLAWENRNQPLGYRSRSFHRTPLVARCEKSAHVGTELRIRKLSREISLEHGARYRTAEAAHVLPERGHDPPRIAAVVADPRCQIEQISASLSLVECPQLRRQELIDGEGLDLGGPGVPPRLDGERADGEPVHRLYPRRPSLPLGDVVSRNHASVSISALTYNRQSEDRVAPSALAAGRSFAKLRARSRTCSLRRSATRSTPPA